MVEENVELLDVTMGRGSYRNFSGKNNDFNKTGARSFSIFLPADVADELREIGWYVKKKPPYGDSDEPQNQLDIAIGYNYMPPTVTLITHDGKESRLGEDSIGILDTADIQQADVTIRPYNWEVNGKTGCKAYLQEMKVWLRPPRRSLNASMHRHEEYEDDPF